MRVPRTPGDLRLPAPLAATALLVVLGMFGVRALAMDVARGFPPPDLGDYLLIEEGGSDGDGDGTNETLVVRYRDPSGDKIFSLTTKGRLWAWSREDQTAGTDIERNYVLRDSNCDGNFDERYSLDEQFKVPDCLK